MVTSVASARQLSPSFVEVVLSGGDLDRFDASPYADSYVKVLFLQPGVDYLRPLDLAAIRESMPAAQRPQQRSYTVRAFDADTAALTLLFVVHGEEGIAGPWARGAQPGDEAIITGPGGAYIPDPTADWHLLVGDESALPAIAVALERLSRTAVGEVFIEVHDAAEELPLSAPAGVAVHWLHRGSAVPGLLLVDAVAALPFRGGRVHAFVHGEAGSVKALRRLLRVERGLPIEQLSISGYWRLGVDDAGWRAGKRQWNDEIARDETAAGVA